MKTGGAIHPRVAEYAEKEAGLLAGALGLPARGYTEEEAEARRAAYGSNAMESRPEDTVAHRLRRAFINPFSVVLFVLAVISFVTDVLLASNYSRDVTTAAIILSMLLIGGSVRFVQELRSKRVADRLTGLMATTVPAWREGRWQELPSAELVVGDRVRLSAGDRVPADLRLTAAAELFVSQSVLTGESAILEKTARPLPKSENRPLAQYHNIAFMGSAVVGGSGEGVVLAVGPDTVYGGFSAGSPGRKNGFDRGANSIAWVLIRFMVVLVPVVFIACGLTKGDWLSAFLFALSVAVGLTPELLPMVTSACLARGAAAMERKQTVVRQVNAMQGFGSMDLLCVDKTGTLTGDTVGLEYYMDVLGNESRRTLELAYLNSLYHTGVKNHLDTAILRCREMPGLGGQLVALAEGSPKLDELPFDYERRCVSVLVEEGGQPLLILKGSVDEVCRRCAWVEHQGRRIPVEGGLSDAHAVVDEMLEDGMKVLAVAYKPLAGPCLRKEDEQGLTLVGYLAFFDAPRQSAAGAIQALRALHVGVRVLTGDCEGTAASVCRRLGIDTADALTGPELERLAEDEAMVRIERASLFAELTPRQKARVVRALQTNGHTVGFLGDGMNDLPAMAQSDVGISVDTAAEAVKEAADVILLKKDLGVLAEGVREGRRAFANVSKYIRITASSNFGNIVAIVIASVVLPFLPMTSVQLLLLNLLYDILCLVLPWDRVDEETCARPLEWSGRTLGRFMRFFGPLSSIFDLVTFGYLFWVLCPSVCGGGYASLSGAAQAEFAALFQTGWFLESIWTQVLILQLLRTRKLPLIQSRPARPVLWVTTLGVLVFTGLVFTPAGGWIGLTPLPAPYFAFLGAVVLLYLLLVTLAKGLYLRKYHELL